MKKASDETVQLAAKDELTGEENTMWEFARDLETEAPKLDNYFGAESSPYLRVKTKIGRKAAILDKIVSHLLLQLLHFLGTFQKV